jgi:hypothetical protein
MEVCIRVSINGKDWSFSYFDQGSDEQGTDRRLSCATFAGYGYDK